MPGQNARTSGETMSVISVIMISQMMVNTMKAKCAVCGFIGYVRYPRSKAGHYQLTKPDLWICENHKEDWR